MVLERGRLNASADLCGGVHTKVLQQSLGSGPREFKAEQVGQGRIGTHRHEPPPTAHVLPERLPQEAVELRLSQHHQRKPPKVGQIDLAQLGSLVGDEALGLQDLAQVVAKGVGSVGLAHDQQDRQVHRDLSVRAE